MQKPQRRVVPVKLAEPPAEDFDERPDRTDYDRIKQEYRNRIHNPATAIRAFCMECSNGQPSEVRYCPVTSCALYPFRMGKNPHNKKAKMNAKAKELGLTLKQYKEKYGNDLTEDEDEDE